MPATPPRTFFVTGATGLVGTNLVRLLASRGERVRVLVREKSDRRGLAGLDVEEVPGDVRDAAALARGMRGADVAVHAAAYVSLVPWRAARMQEVTVGGTANVVAAAREAGVRRLVHVSSVAAVGPGTLEHPADEDTPLGPSFGPYWSTKREAEALVLKASAAGLDAVVVNPAFVFGPWDLKPSSGGILLRAAAGGYPAWPGGVISVVGAEDVAQGIVLAADKGARGRRYILSSESLTWRALLDLVADVTGGPRARVPMPRPLAQVLGRVGDRVGRRLPAFSVTFNSNTVAAMFEQGAVTAARARRELGFAPQPARHAVEQAWSWFRANGYVRRGRPEVRG